MSSFSDKQQPSSSQFYPPQSVQPYQSLFGGPSSDVDPPPSSLPEPLRRPGASLFGGPVGLDTISERDIASDPMELSQADGDYDEYGTVRFPALGGPDHVAFLESDTVQFEDRDPDVTKSSQPNLEQPILPSSSETIRPALATQTYFLNRGRDLPLGVERPNRWNGPASTYRRLTADDRGAYEGIVTERARDLAAHLYNAHAYRNRRHLAPSKPEEAREADGPERHFPPRRWVAWPRPAPHVPRPDESIQRQLDGPDSMHMQSDLRPSYNVEESVIAIMMKHAKETFLAREWDLEEVKVSRLSRGDDTDDMKDEDLKDADEKDEAPQPDVVPLQPIVQADDGLSRKQLRPLSRNVISQIDRLLMGLHHSVKTRFQDDDSSSESEIEGRDTDYETSRSRSRRVSGTRSQSRGRKRARRQSSHSQTSSHRSRSGRSSTAASTQTGSAGSPSRSRGRSRTSRTSRTSADLSATKYRLALRDWSEVMGIAAMMGLPSAAVARASKRCADLFGEDMTFRTFQEGRMVKVPPTKGSVRSGDKWEYYESDTDVETEPELQHEAAPTIGPSELDSISSPRKRKQRSRVRSRSQSHSRRHRSSSAVGPPAPTVAAVVSGNSVPGSDFADQLGDAGDTAGQLPALPVPKGRGEHRKADIICPVKRCSRHTHGFSRTWNLTLHMRRVHPNYVPGDRERSRSQSTPGGVEVIEID
ncbi:hypothetical protein POX_b02348 [Penicillium oxalicum]|uniref:hypothetical protein n=1 Tax=Penicillium oxalicum TaxID=69781 RepID=UPI0020B8E4E3|nr:hypothetical protein POX_b02348 [Penicillium oxalicum]KAI2792311.1 hypothetical protein POX_b02348 [Penicillium oxalicum]